MGSRILLEGSFVDVRRSSGMHFFSGGGGYRDDTEMLCLLVLSQVAVSRSWTV